MNKLELLYVSRIENPNKIVPPSESLALLIGVKIPLNQKIIKEMIAGMNERERETFRKELEKQKPEMDEKSKAMWKEAQEVLDQLNRRTGKNFKAKQGGKPTASLRLIFQTLKKGYTKAQCLAVIDIKIRQKCFISDNYLYMRPSTLFRASNFENYVQEIRE